MCALLVSVASLFATSFRPFLDCLSLSSRRSSYLTDGLVIHEEAPKVEDESKYVRVLEQKVVENILTLLIRWVQQSFIIVV